MNMADTDSGPLNYFTCTLGQSVIWKRQQPEGASTGYHTVLELVDDKAQESPDDAAIGFADFTFDKQGHDGKSLRYANGGFYLF